MIIVSDIQIQKHDPNILYYENDFFKNYSSFLEGTNGSNYRFYLDRELSVEEAIEFLETNVDNCIYFHKSEVLSVLMTKKLLEKTICAPFQWKNVTYQEGFNVLNCVDFYFKYNPEQSNYMESIDKSTFKKELCNKNKQSWTLTKNVEIIDIKNRNNLYEITFQVDEQYNKEKLKVVDSSNKEYQFEVKEKTPTQVIYAVSVSNREKISLKIMYLNGNLNFQANNKLKFGVVSDRKLHLRKFDLLQKMKILFIK